MSMIARNTTLCYLEKGERYLMLHRVKKENDLNHDKWIGVGGKFEADESPEDCLLRECREETGLTLTEYRYRGVVTFVSDTWETEYMHLFTATGWTGEQTVCDEGDLEWIEKAKLRSLPLWEGDLLFLRLLEEGAPFFSLKLRYEGETLAEAALNGRTLTAAERRGEAPLPAGGRPAILVSACLLGCACRYDGKSKGNAAVQALARDYQLIPVCPEQLGGLSTPREPSERRGDRVVMKSGRDVTAEYRRGGGGGPAPGGALRLWDRHPEGEEPLLRQRAHPRRELRRRAGPWGRRHGGGPEGPRPPGAGGIPGGGALRRFACAKR